MRKTILRYGTGSTPNVAEVVSSSDQLVARLQELHATLSAEAKMPIGVEVCIDDGCLADDPSQCERMCVVMDDEEWMLLYYAANDRGEWVSQGDISRDGFLAFMLEQWSELSRKYLIPREDAIAALRLWCASEQRPDNIPWTTTHY